MEDGTARASRLTIGLDLGDQYSYLCVMDPAGKFVEEGRIATTKEALRRRFGACEPATIAIEVGTHSPWVSRLLRELGHKVLVANPRKLRMIYENDDKMDRVDARWLARVARLDPELLAPIQHRSASAQADLAQIRARDALVSSRTQLVNHVRGVVKSCGERVAKCSTHSFPKKSASAIPEALRPALSPVVVTLSYLNEQISVFDRRIEEMANERYPQSANLRQVAGVGPITSVAYMLILGDPHRFKTSRSVGPYLGLRTRKNQTGEQDPQLRITKAGDTLLRRLLVGSAHYILGPFGPDCDLRRFGMARAQRGGKIAKKIAVVAVARKLAVLLHHLWITGEVYEPLYQAKKEKMASSR